MIQWFLISSTPFQRIYNHKIANTIATASSTDTLDFLRFRSYDKEGIGRPFCFTEITLTTRVLIMLIGYIPFIFLSDQGDMKQDAAVWNIKTTRICSFRN